MHTIRRIDAFSAGTVFAMMYTLGFAILNLIRLIAFAFGSDPLFPIYYSTGEEMTFGVALINYGLGLVINYGSAGIFGALLATVYNILVPLTGGLQINID
ncbi:MAG: hypothetical protein OHK0046_10350 [Anaerolineae bacterium]